MSKVIQISILGKIAGNANADEVIGTRITLKKMYSSTGEVLPFVSARAVKYAIRQKLKEKGYDVDPFVIDPQAREALRLSDSGNPVKYIDNDLFGYMRTVGRRERALRRQAPVALSYFKALRDTPIKAEFAARFSRPWGKEENPVPFEVEVAEFIGKINSIIYDYVGDFTQDRKIAESMSDSKEAKEFLKNIPEKLPPNLRKERVGAFLEIFLTPSYVLPRRTNSLSIPEHIASLVVLSHNGPLPVFQYLNYDFENNKVDTEKLEVMTKMKMIDGVEFFLVDYFNQIEKVPEGIRVTPLKALVKKASEFIVSEEKKSE